MSETPEGRELLPLVEGDDSVESPERGMFGVHGTGDTSGFGELVRAPHRLESAQRPYGGYFDDVADTFRTALADAGLSWDAVVRDVVVHRGEITFYLTREHLPTSMQILRDHQRLRFEMLASLSGVDYLDADPEDPERLHVVYQLRSYTYARMIRCEVAVTVEDPHLSSVTSVYPTADWQEREAYDMFGVIFDGHPALTRILMPDDWSGYPQRKDYPLGGVPVEYKDAQIPPPDTRRTYS